MSRSRLRGAGCKCRVPLLTIKSHRACKNSTVTTACTSKSVETVSLTHTDKTKHNKTKSVIKLGISKGIGTGKYSKRNTNSNSSNPKQQGKKNMSKTGQG